MAMKSSSVCALEPEKITKTKWAQWYGTPCITKDLELVGLLYGLCLTLHLADVVTSIVYVQVPDVQVNAWKIFYGVKNILSMLKNILLGKDILWKMNITINEEDGKNCLVSSMSRTQGFCLKENYIWKARRREGVWRSGDVWSCLFLPVVTSGGLQGDSFIISAILH